MLEAVLEIMEKNGVHSPDQQLAILCEFMESIPGIEERLGELTKLVEELVEE